MFRSLHGRRLVDINHFFKQIMNSRHEKFDCSFLDMDFKMEIRKGYCSKFKFECKMCGTVTYLPKMKTKLSIYLLIKQ